MDKQKDFPSYVIAANQSLKAFPIDGGRIEPLAIGENIVFRVTDSRDVNFVMRLHRPGYHTLEELNSERIWTAALNDAGIGVPNGIRALDGCWYVNTPTPDPEGFRFVGLTTWSQGEVFSDIISRDPADAALGHYARLGELVARMHNQSAKWRPQPGFSRHSLDLDGLVGEAAYWGRFWESNLLTVEERRIVADARMRIMDKLRGLAKTDDMYSLIHADLHPGNVLIHAEQLSVIDFDDAAFGWHAYDAAVALFDAWGQPHYPLLRDAFLTGYHDKRPEAAALRRLLPLFLIIRGLMHIGWLEQRPELDPLPYMKLWRQRLLMESESLIAS